MRKPGDTVRFRLGMAFQSNSANSFTTGNPACYKQRRAGRVAIVIADNLHTHTTAGSKLVRQMLDELHGHLYLVYTPAYDS